MFATSGLAAAVVFLFESENVRLVARVWERVSSRHDKEDVEDAHRLTESFGLRSAHSHKHANQDKTKSKPDEHAFEFAGEHEASEGIRLAHSGWNRWLNRAHYK